MTETLYDQAMAMYQRKEYDELKAFKKCKKKSWNTLGINPEMLNLVMGLAPNQIISENDRPLAPIVSEAAALTNRSSSAKSNQRPVQKKAMSKRRLLRLANTDLRLLRYTPQQIHAIKGETSHGTIAQISAIREQEKFRADPRFPLMRAMKRIKRYKEIFAGLPYKPIFS